MAERDPAVDGFLKDLAHPMQAEIEELRELILAAALGVQEGIKWNSMSFRTTEWFATLNKRALDKVEFVLHLGAKPGGEASSIRDPNGLLNWRGADRALLTLKTPEEVRLNRQAIAALIREWIKHLPA